MKIGIIGAGRVAGSLGPAWAAKGHQVIYGVREQDREPALKLCEGPDVTARVGTVREAADVAEVLLLAVPWETVRGVIDELGDLSGKILLEPANPLTPDLAGVSVGLTTSAGEQVAEWAPGARVVKIFNMTGFNSMSNPQYGEFAATMLYAGDDVEAKAVAARLATEIGFDARDAGPLKISRLLEPVGALLTYLIVHQKFNPEMAWVLLTR
ncbi:MAG: NADPH-dependent F420 reductase [Capsulimonadaceae bacterium]